MSEPIRTGHFQWTNKEVNEEALDWSKKTGIYWTGIKGKPRDPDMPDKCWAITNKFDPAIVAEQQNSE